MAKRITQKQLKHDEFVDAAFDFGHWIEQHWAKVAGWVGFVLFLVVAVVLWGAWSRHRAGVAEERLAKAIDQYHEAQAGGFASQAGLTAALEGLEEVVDDVGGGPGQVARFYRGATLFHLDRLDEARDDLRQVVDGSGAADTLGATAQLFLARVEVAAGRSEEAIQLLQGLAADPEAAIPPAQALLELGRVHRDAGRPEEARAQWQRIVDEYPQSVAAAEANSLLQ
jgi:predicted negative regulator of RcsB-dependent stress response